MGIYFGGETYSITGGASVGGSSSDEIEAIMSGDAYPATRGKKVMLNKSGTPPIAGENMYGNFDIMNNDTSGFSYFPKLNLVGIGYDKRNTYYYNYNKNTKNFSFQFTNSNIIESINTKYNMGLIQQFTRNSPVYYYNKLTGSFDTLNSNWNRWGFTYDEEWLLQWVYNSSATTNTINVYKLEIENDLPTMTLTHSFELSHKLHNLQLSVDDYSLVCRDSDYFYAYDLDLENGIMTLKNKFEDDGYYVIGCGQYWVMYGVANSSTDVGIFTFTNESYKKLGTFSVYANTGHYFQTASIRYTGYDDIVCLLWNYDTGTSDISKNYYYKIPRNVQLNSINEIVRYGNLSATGIYLDVKNKNGLITTSFNGHIGVKYLENDTNVSNFNYMGSITYIDDNGTFIQNHPNYSMYIKNEDESFTNVGTANSYAYMMTVFMDNGNFALPWSLTNSSSRYYIHGNTWNSLSGSYRSTSYHNTFSENIYMMGAYMNDSSYTSIIKCKDGEISYYTCSSSTVTMSYGGIMFIYDNNYYVVRVTNNSIYTVHLITFDDVNKTFTLTEDNTKTCSNIGYAYNNYVSKHLSKDNKYVLTPIGYHQFNTETNNLDWHTYPSQITDLVLESGSSLQYFGKLNYNNEFDLQLANGMQIICKYTDDIQQCTAKLIPANSSGYLRSSPHGVYYYRTYNNGYNTSNNYYCSSCYRGDIEFPSNTPQYTAYGSTNTLWNSTSLTGFMTGESRVDENGINICKVKTALPITD